MMAFIGFVAFFGFIELMKPPGAESRPWIPGATQWPKNPMDTQMEIGFEGDTRVRGRSTAESYIGIGAITWEDANIQDTSAALVMAPR